MSCLKIIFIITNIFLVVTLPIANAKEPRQVTVAIVDNHIITAQDVLNATNRLPKEIKVTVEKQTVIKISGVDKDLVSKIAADIKNLKPVEPYKAKGIKERGQFVLRKEGKKK